MERKVVCGGECSCLVPLFALNDRRDRQTELRIAAPWKSTTSKSVSTQRDPHVKIVMAKFLQQNAVKSMYVVALHCWRCQHKGWTHLARYDSRRRFCVPLSRGSNRLPPTFQAAIAVIRPRWVAKKPGSTMQEYSTFVESSRNSDDNVAIGQVAMNAKLPTKNYVHDELRPCGTPSRNDIHEASSVKRVEKVQWGDPSINSFVGGTLASLHRTVSSIQSTSESSTETAKSQVDLLVPIHLQLRKGLSLKGGFSTTPCPTPQHED